MLLSRAVLILSVACSCGAPAREPARQASATPTAAAPQCTRLEGIVVDLDDGDAPIAGAAVNIAEGPLDDHMSQVREVTGQPTLTDAHGHFVFDPMPKVALEVLAYSAEYIVRSKLTQCGPVRIGIHRKAQTADVQVYPLGRS